MKSHVLARMALALIVATLFGMGQMDVQAAEQTVLEMAIPVPSSPSGDGRGDGANDDPDLGTVNGDPEDWLGGQNLKPDPVQRVPVMPPGESDQISSFFARLLAQFQKLIR